MLARRLIICQVTKKRPILEKVALRGGATRVAEAVIRAQVQALELQLTACPELLTSPLCYVNPHVARAPT